jgi:hypothetical protein
MFTKATIALLLAIGLSSGALAATKLAPGQAPLITVPHPTGPEAPLRTWDDYGQRWE